MATAKKTTTAKTAEAETPAGLDSTGNPLDLSAPNQSNVSSDIAHQDSAPAELAKLADEQAEAGYIGTGVPEKADYSQANPAVMNQDG